MINVLEDLYKYKSILCLDGDLPCDLIKKINLPIIAADGAANTLIPNGLEPMMIIGDLDSVDPSLLSNRAHWRVECQDSTDFEKSLNFIKAKSLDPTIVMGISGGCIDHTLGNISIFSETEFIAISGNIIFMPLNGSRNFNVPIGTKISIFGMPSCTIRSKGLKWELNGQISLSGKNSISNRAATAIVELEILSGRAMIFIYRRSNRKNSPASPQSRGMLFEEQWRF
ncbi:MAG: thiamine diphosphokinase [Holosporaceae bacterium]|jgi:thiamine pyrophosphokinase|nr:thiamine diphosphokinase [Holosporaceae bacterium]